MFQNPQPAIYQHILLDCHNIQHRIDVKRIDLVHPTIAGNKWYKLKHNLRYAKQHGYQQVISFGGAYSNHIYALAQACQLYQLDSVGIIRGNELAHKPLNPKLAKVAELGMQLSFIPRAEYRQKHMPNFLAKLANIYPNAYVIPEGGSNDLAVKGCMEILTQQDRQNYDMICCAVGTGGTIAGIINASNPTQQVLGFAAVNADLTATIQQWSTQQNWQVLPDDVFGGYGKYNDELLTFINRIQTKHHVPLEPIYTGKALYRLWQFLQSMPATKKMRVLFIHTGGLYTDE